MKRRDFLAGAVTDVTSAGFVGLAGARSCSEGALPVSDSGRYLASTRPGGLGRPR
jgi:hypothetical protein